MRDVTVRTGEGKFQQVVLTGPHQTLADEPKELGGDDTGLAPFDYVLGRAWGVYVDDRENVCGSEIVAIDARERRFENEQGG